MFNQIEASGYPYVFGKRDFATRRNYKLIMRSKLDYVSP